MKIISTKQLYKLRYNRNEIKILYYFIDWLITLPKELDIEYNYEILKFEEEQNMTYVCTAERLGIEKGIKQGIEKGMSQGISQGLENCEF